MADPLERITRLEERVTTLARDHLDLKTARARDDARLVALEQARATDQEHERTTAQVVADTAIRSHRRLALLGLVFTALNVAVLLIDAFRPHG